MSRPAVAVGALVAVATVLAAAYWLLGPPTVRQGAAGATVTAASSPAVGPAISAATSEAVEVPDVVGATLKEARIVLEAAGLRVSAAAAADSTKVGAQEPSSGTIVSSGETVSLQCPTEALDNDTGASSVHGGAKKLVVCIDPGHQRRSNRSPEPIGPGSKKTKLKVSGGTTGVSTGLPEYEVTLQIAMNLKKRLEAAGMKVVMTRTTNDVDVSNAERAAVANKAKADLFLRIHCDGSPDSKTSGVSTLYPKKNSWTAKTSRSSKSAASTLHQSLVAATGAVDRGITARGDLSGFNHSRVPSVLVECGFMSNTVEDRLLASPHYQDKIAEGLAAGVSTWLNATQ